MERLREIDFWNNDYDINIAFHTKGTTSHMSVSKRDRQDKVKEEEIINALALGIIGMSNAEGTRYENILKRILDRCTAIEKEQERIS